VCPVSAQNEGPLFSESLNDDDLPCRPGWSGWTASFNGQLSGNSPESQFFGNVTVTGTPQSGGGTCTGQMQISGATRANTLRWEAPTMTLVPTGTPAGATVCLGDVRTIVWIFGR
jgi:hypothetical protein